MSKYHEEAAILKHSYQHGMEKHKKEKKKNRRGETFSLLLADVTEWTELVAI